MIVQNKGENIMSTATVKGQYSRDEAGIRALIETVHKAHHGKDAAAIVAPYAHDAAVFSLAPPLSHIGMDLEEKQAWLDTWEGPIDLESRDLSFSTLTSWLAVPRERAESSNRVLIIVGIISCLKLSH
jgi:hypothetical protein